MLTEKGTTSSPAALSEEIEEAKPVPLVLDILPTPPHTDPLDPVVLAVPPGFDAKKPTAARGKFKPILYAFGSAHKPGRVQKCKTPISDEKTASKKAKLVVRSPSSDPVLLASSSNAATRDRAHVEATLATFNALRRRLEQISETDRVNKRSDMKAEMIMNANDLMANKNKRVGAVPGVEVGDIFYFRMEMRVVGLHLPPMGGIDHMEDDDNDLIAIAIVSSGGYNNKDNKIGEMEYSGQGGKGRNGEKRSDQKLEGGNYAMKRSYFRQNSIRVIRSRKDPFIPANKVYIYDGLYKIRDSWYEQDTNTKRGTFKHHLVKESGQPDGFAVWKLTEEWKKEPSSRGTVLTFDLSSGVESIPIIVVNEVDDEPEPDNFTYVAGIVHEQTVRVKDMVSASCKCKTLCSPVDGSCYCAINNGGWLPYSSTGLLIKRLPVLYECGSSCECSVNCRNRVTQRGIKLHFEVFRTENRGWGLRSWDPIRAGSFVCEFAGKRLDSLDPDSKEWILNEYVFCAIDPGEKALKWNEGMELAEERGENTGDEKCYEPEQVPLPVPVPVMINAKEMGNVSRFINHSCDPNLFWQLVRYGDQYSHVMFFAMKHIPPMTELTYDYNGRGVRARKCLCGVANCGGYFR